MKNSCLFMWLLTFQIQMIQGKKSCFVLLDILMTTTSIKLDKWKKWKNQIKSDILLLCVSLSEQTRKTKTKQNKKMLFLGILFLFPMKILNEKQNFYWLQQVLYFYHHSFIHFPHWKTHTHKNKNSSFYGKKLNFWFGQEKN